MANLEKAVVEDEDEEEDETVVQVVEGEAETATLPSDPESATPKLKQPSKKKGKKSILDDEELFP